MATAESKSGKAATAVLTSRNLYLLGLCVIACSMSWSPFLTSLGQWLMVTAWFLDRGLAAKLRSTLRRRDLLAFLAFYAICAAGMLWSSDLTFGARDIKIKLPMLVIALVVATSQPLTNRELGVVMYSFAAGILGATIAGYQKILFEASGIVTDHRDISPVISHIRLSLMIDLAVVFLATQAVHFWERSKTKVVGIVATILYLLVFLVVLRSLSGVVIMAAAAFVVMLAQLRKLKNRRCKALILGAIACAAIATAGYGYASFKRYSTPIDPDLENLPAVTANGAPYKHNLASNERENGHRIDIFLCYSEMQYEWERRSSIPFNGVDKNGYQIENTLKRFLTGKGLPKDSIGVAQLTDREVKAIENGIANHIFLNRWSLYPRLYELFWEIDAYRNGDSPSGKSVVQRLLYLEAGWSIFLDNPLIGCGLGDTEALFQQYYNENKSRLDTASRHRAHNQYLTILLSLGLLGFAVFAFSQAYPVAISIKKRRNSPLLLPFAVIALLSMLSEDTLETQAGATFYAFFYSLFVWGASKDDTTESTKGNKQNSAEASQKMTL